MIIGLASFPATEAVMWRIHNDKALFWANLTRRPKRPQGESKVGRSRRGPAERPGGSRMSLWPCWILAAGQLQTGDDVPVQVQVMDLSRAAQHRKGEADA